MKDKLPSSWAASPANLRRAILAQDLANGFACGPLDMQLENELMFRLTQLNGEVVNAFTFFGLTPNENDLTQLRQAIVKAATSTLDNKVIVGATTLNYSSAGTYQWTAPDGVTHVQVEAWSGGGGGGGASATGSAAAGGGGGVYGKGTYAVTPGTTYTITVGAGGTAGAASGSAPGMGGTGGTTSFSNFMSLTGGRGGQAAVGGTATQLSDTGTASGPQTAVGGYFGGLPINAGGSLIGGSGGSAYGASAPPPNVGPANGNPGVFPGGGGTGASGLASGGPGGSGRLILTF